MNFSNSKQERSATSAALELVAEDFQRFGLASRESRTEIIRNAVKAYVQSISLTAKLWVPSRLDSQLALVAWTAYKLLDPRRRKDAIERVQLCYSLERFSEEIPQLPPRAILRKPKPPLIGKIEEDRSDVPSDLVELVDRAVQSTSSESVVVQREIVKILREDVPASWSFSGMLKRWFLILLVTASIPLGAFILFRSSHSPRVNPIESTIAEESNSPKEQPARFTDSNRRLADRGVHEGRPQDSNDATEMTSVNHAAPSIMITTQSVRIEDEGSENSNIATSDATLRLRESPSTLETKPSVEQIQGTNSKVAVDEPKTVVTELAAHKIQEARDGLAKLIVAWQNTLSVEERKNANRIAVLKEWSSEAPSGSADRFVMLESLARQSAKQEGLRVGLDYCESIEKEFGDLAWTLRAELYERHHSEGRSMEEHRAIAKLGIELCERAMVAEELKIAAKLARYTVTAANRSRDQELKNTAIKLRDSIVSSRLKS